MFALAFRKRGWTFRPAFDGDVTALLGRTDHRFHDFEHMQSNVAIGPMGAAGFERCRHVEKADDPIVGDGLALAVLTIGLTISKGADVE